MRVPSDAHRRNRDGEGVRRRGGNLFE